MHTWPTFARQFAELLDDKQVTLYRLEEDTGLFASNMHAVMTGKRRASDRAIQVLAEYFDMPAVTLEAWRALDEVSEVVLREMIRIRFGIEVPKDGRRKKP